VSVVKHFYPRADGCTSRGPTLPLLWADSRSFERTQAALGDSISPALRPRAHPVGQSGVCQESSQRPTDGWAATVGVEHEPRLRGKTLAQSCWSRTYY